MNETIKKFKKVRKAQQGLPLWLQNSLQGAAVAENPAVMTASGWKVDRNGNVEQDSQNDKGVEQLRDNLVTIGEAAITAPTLTSDIGKAYLIIRHPIKNLWKIKSIFKSDPLILHKLRAITKGYDLSNIRYIDFNDKKSFENFAKEFAIKEKISIKDALQELDMENKTASALRGYRTILYNSRSEPNKLNIALSHELDHIIAKHETQIPLKVFNPPQYKKYYFNNYNSEASARGSLIHDWLGHSGKEPITENNLLDASKNYVRDTGINNNMTNFFSGIQDYNEMAKWLSKYSTGITFPVVISKLNK